jgi:hypothetical protein
MSHLSLALIITLLVTSLAHAQRDSAWPPDPDDLFAPGVEIVRVDPVADNNARVLYLYESGEWRAYPYPDDFNAIGFPEGDSENIARPHVYERPDGLWFVFERDVEKWYRYHTWTLDPATGAFARVDPPCGVDRELDQQSGNSVLTEVLEDEHTPFADAWVFVQTPRATMLCSMLSGAKTRMLPDNVVRWAYAAVPLLPAVSPDGRYVVFMTNYWQPDSNHYEVYSYRPDTGDLIDLGRIYPDLSNDFDFLLWLDDTHFAFSFSDMPEWSGRNVYAGDASQPASVDYAASMLRFWPCIRSDPPSVEGLDAAMEDGPSAGPCFLEHYDALTRQRTLYDTGDLCDYGVPIPDGSGDRLHRTISPAAALVRYGLDTGARMFLFIGEVETVGAVSPGGSYAVIGLGRNGTIDIGQDPDPNSMGYRFGEEYVDSVVKVYVIIGLNTGMLIGEFPRFAQWFTDDTFIVTPPDQPNRSVRIQGGVLAEAELPGKVMLALPERGQLLLQNPDGSADLYTLETGIGTPLSTGVPGLSYSVRQQEDGMLRVSVARSLQPGTPPVTYTIRLP